MPDNYKIVFPACSKNARVLLAQKECHGDDGVVAIVPLMLLFLFPKKT